MDAKLSVKMAGETTLKYTLRMQIKVTAVVETGDHQQQRP